MTEGVFGEIYSSLYDDLYEEKAYDAEVDYLENIWSELGKSPNDVLDIGCGTGEHGMQLAERGYKVHGIDRSEKMVNQAKRKIAAHEIDEFTVNLRNVTALDCSEQFDTAIAMFAVMGYLTTNDELVTALRRIRSALRSDGLFIFDTWYGPAVLFERPEPRLVKKDKDEGSIFRYASPELNVRDQIVTVNFDIFRFNENHIVNRLQEAHEMRFFFEKELEALAQISGFEVRSVHPFADIDGEVGESTWSVTWVLECTDR